MGKLIKWKISGGDGERPRRERSAEIGPRFPGERVCAAFFRVIREVPLGTGNLLYGTADGRVFRLSGKAR